MPENYRIFSKKENNLNLAADIYNSLDLPCPYNFPAYMVILSRHLYDNIDLNVFWFQSGSGKVFYPFFRRSLENCPGIEEKYRGYSDIIGSWYFGGPNVYAENGPELIKEYGRAFSRFCAKENIVAEFVRFDPNVENHLDVESLYDIRLNRETVWVDLTGDEDLIWKNYKGRCRTAVRKAQNHGITVRESKSPEHVDAFAEIYQAEMERKADSRHYYFSKAFFRELIQTLPGEFKFFFAFHNNTLCGGTLLYFKGDTVYDFLMATGVEFWKYQPNNILLHSAIMWAKSQGFRIFDLMGGRPGVFGFKSSFSDLRQRFFVGRKIYHPEIYQDLEKMTAKRAGKTFNPEFFPVYRQLEMTEGL